MKTEFSIIATCVLKNGKVVIAGVTNGRLLKAGEEGRMWSQQGELVVKISSVGFSHPAPANPGVQLLQIALIRGNSQFLQGGTLEFV